MRRRVLVVGAGTGRAGAGGDAAGGDVAGGDVAGGDAAGGNAAGGNVAEGDAAGGNAAAGDAAGGEGGQALVLLIGLVVLVLMVLALGWDTSNWFLGHRALANLADGAAVAAANDVDTGVWYASGGRSVRVAQQRARSTVAAYLDGSADDSGVAGVTLRSVQVVPGQGGPEVTVRVAAPARGGLLRLLRLVPPEMEGRAAATARLVSP